MFNSEKKDEFIKQRIMELFNQFVATFHFLNNKIWNTEAQVLPPLPSPHLAIGSRNLNYVGRMFVLRRSPGLRRRRPTFSLQTSCRLTLIWERSFAPWASVFSHGK